jgi:hypothetical protein
MRAWVVRAAVALIALGVLGATALSIVDGWRPAGGNGVPWIEALVRNEPTARVDDYVHALAAGDRDAAMSVWQIPVRGDSDRLGALWDRRAAVTDALLAARVDGYGVVGLEWWSTCCEPHPVTEKTYASAARLTVRFAGATPVGYFVDLRTADRDRSLLDEVARQWVLADIYPLTDDPISLPWVATRGGSQPVRFAKKASDATDCGSTEEMPGTTYDGRGRDCLWAAWQTSAPARWAVTSRTVEGDPTPQVLIIENGLLWVRRDMTADRFSAPADRRVWRWACHYMTKQPWATDPSRFSFHLDGCWGDGVTASFP